MRSVYRFPMMLAVMIMFSAANLSRAAEPSAGPTSAGYRPKPEQVAKLEIYPSQVRLRGWHDAAQLIVTA
ncbi:MAG: hypothetical protein RMJ19_02910, partial [Gemmatales bacterium]|nr:hypothetical protein [Gemmatales bacterium]MDW8174598.1 hypothetical protein [Gemmatales bacterium]